MGTVAVCITARNEPDIESLARQICGLGYYPIIVDAASDPPVNLSFCKVLHNDEKLGIGGSLMRAWRMAIDGGAEFVLQMDAGGSHDPRELHLLRAVLEFADLVIGSRFLPSSQYIGNAPRAALSRLAAAACNTSLIGPALTDWTSGFRGFRRATVEYLLSRHYFARMHGWQIETLWYAQQYGMKIAEIPITYRAGRSSFNWQIAGEAFTVWKRMIANRGDA